MAKSKQLFKRESYDGKLHVEVVDLPYKRNLLARSFLNGRELSHRYFGYEFPDIQDYWRAADKANAWLFGTLETYNAMKA